MDKTMLKVILVLLGIGVVASMEFLVWNPENYANVKSIPDSVAAFLTLIGLTITYFLYMFVRKKGWWNVNSKYEDPR